MEFAATNIPDQNGLSERRTTLSSHRGKIGETTVSGSPALPTALLVGTLPLQGCSVKIQTCRDSRPSELGRWFTGKVTSTSSRKRFGKASRLWIRLMDCSSYTIYNPHTRGITVTASEVHRNMSIRLFRKPLRTNSLPVLDTITM